MPLPTSGTFAELMASTEHTFNVRKSLQLLLLLGLKSKVTTTPTAATLLDATGKFTPPTGMWGAGILDPKGIELDIKTESEGIEGYNYTDDVRTDVIKIARSMSFTPLEPDRMEIQSLVRGIDLSTKTMDPATKTLEFDEPTLPVDLDYVGLVIIRDISKKSGADYFDCRWFTSLTMEERSKETWAKKGAKALDIKLKCGVDTSVGTPCRHIYGGAGFAETYDLLGYAAPAA